MQDDDVGDAAGRRDGRVAAVAGVARASDVAQHRDAATPRPGKLPAAARQAEDQDPGYRDQVPEPDAGAGVLRPAVHAPVRRLRRFNDHQLDLKFSSASASPRTILPPCQGLVS